MLARDRLESSHEVICDGAEARLPDEHTATFGATPRNGFISFDDESRDLIHYLERNGNTCGIVCRFPFQCRRCW
jgi:hypothetical protein